MSPGPSRLGIAHEHGEELDRLAGLDRPASATADEQTDARVERDPLTRDGCGPGPVEDVEDLVGGLIRALAGASRAEAQHALRKLLAAVSVVE